MNSSSTPILPLVPLTALSGNEPTHLNHVQTLLAPHVTTLATIWWFIWIITLAVVVRYIFTHGTHKDEN